MKNIIFAILIISLFLIGCENKKILNVVSNDSIPEQNYPKIGTNLDRKYWGEENQNNSIRNNEQRIQNLASCGVKMITFYKVLYMDGLNDFCFHNQFPSTNPGWLNYSDEELSSMIQKAHSLGMEVKLAIEVLPIIPGSGWYPGYIETWRGFINPSNISYWFSNFQIEITNIAEFAKNQNVEILDIGQELVTMTSPQNTYYWQQIVNTIRQVYQGKITYCFNGGPYNKTLHSFTNCEYLNVSPAFCSLFDKLSFTMYPNLSNERIPSVDSLKNEIHYIVNFLEEVHNETQKQIEISETSCPSIEFPLIENYVLFAWNANSLNSKTISEIAQANYMKALKESFSKKSWFTGLYWHNSYNNPDNPDNDILLSKGPSPLGIGLLPKLMLLE